VAGLFILRHLRRYRHHRRQILVHAVYITSIGGRTNHWSTTGATSIYPTPPAQYATPTGFRVYVRWANGGPLTPATANSYGWHINWIGMEI
jgi:hypothetical protein